MTKPPFDQAPPRILGLAIAMSAVAMLLGIAGGIVALTRMDFVGAGVCLLATGVSAGLVLNAVLRT
jgi:hypothetical protein